MKYYIGIDNGVTGSVTILDDSGNLVFHEDTPAQSTLDYQKSKATFISRIDASKLRLMLNKTVGHDKLALLERPMINSLRFKSSISAARCLEATLIVLEDLSIPYRYIDSKEWQGIMLPAGTAKERLKLASDCVCKRLYPNLTLTKAGNGDSVLMARYAVDKKL